VKTRWRLKLLTSGRPKYILTIMIQSQKKMKQFFKAVKHPVRYNNFVRINKPLRPDLQLRAFPIRFDDFSYVVWTEMSTAQQMTRFFRPAHVHWFQFLLSVLHCD
jgi:hypothetical protein